MKKVVKKVATFEKLGQCMFEAILGRLGKGE